MKWLLLGAVVVVAGIAVWRLLHRGLSDRMEMSQERRAILVGAANQQERDYYPNFI